METLSRSVSTSSLDEPGSIPVHQSSTPISSSSSSLPPSRPQPPPASSSTSATFVLTSVATSTANVASRRPRRPRPATQTRRRRRRSVRHACPKCQRTIRGSIACVTRHIDRCIDEEDEASIAVAVATNSANEEPVPELPTDLPDVNLIDHPRSTLFPDALGGVVTKIDKSLVDNDERIDVEENEETNFGHSQYSEFDVVPFVSIDEPIESGERLAIRDAILGTSTSTASIDSSSALRSRCSYRLRRSKGKTNLLDDDDDEDSDDEDAAASAAAASFNKSSKLASQMTQTEENHDAESIATIAFLKARLKSLESQTATIVSEDDKLDGQQQQGQQRPSAFRCLICMDAYLNPVVSTSCWHVHCEECWLRVLGVKKLCPQCNVITSPSHLRKVFI